MEPELTNEPKQRPGPAPRTDDKVAGVIKRVEQMWKTMQGDREALDLYADYAAGKHAEPHVPNYADPTTRTLAERSIVNLIRLAINIPAQISYIDGYSRTGDFEPPEWEVWHESQMPAKQTRLFISSLTYGAAYTMLSNIGSDDRRIDLLSSRDTVCYFKDPINDTVPIWALTIKSHPNGKLDGHAIYLDKERVVDLSFNGGEFKIMPKGDKPHKLGMTPLVRWPAVLDDRGYARGVVEDLITVQDNVNQTAYDLLLLQSFGSYNVRWGAGLVGEPLFHEDGTPQVDAEGKQVYGPITVSQSRMLTTDDPNAKFGTLEATPLAGFIDALDSSIKRFSVVGQLPPHSLLGSMSNLSAETLQALMGQTTRFVQMLKGQWADAARVQMRMVAKDMGIEDVKASGTEMRWRDMSDYTIAALMDALGKASEMLGVPGRGLWSRIPGATDAEIAKWDDLREQERQFAEVEDPESPSAALNREVQPGFTNTSTESTTENEVLRI